MSIQNGNSMVWRPLILACIVIALFVGWNSWGDYPDQKFPSVLEEPFWTQADSTLTREELSDIDIYKSASPATVHITSTVLHRNWFLDVYPSESTGSGFLIDPEGRIVTNYHVIRGSSSLEVTPLEDGNNGRVYKASILATDPANDLALIQIDAKKSMPYLSLGDSDSVQVGQKVLAIGNPFGLEGTLTTGVISSIGRSIQDRSGILNDLIQTDAAINPGNSGGPLLDSSGNVIGVNTAIYGPGGNLGIGFAMPISRVESLLRFVKGGAQPPQQIGIDGFFLPPGYARAMRLEKAGFLVTAVEPGSAAEQAGLSGADREVTIGNYRIPWGGDLIIAIDGVAITAKNKMKQALALKLAGDTVEFDLIRQGRPMQVSVTLQPRDVSL